MFELSKKSEKTVDVVYLDKYGTKKAIVTDDAFSTKSKIESEGGTVLGVRKG